MGTSRLIRRSLCGLFMALGVAGALLPAGATALPAPDALRLVAIRLPSSASVRLLGGFDLAEAARPGEVDAVLHPGDAGRLRALGFRWRTLVSDLEALDRASLAAGAGGSRAAAAPGERADYRRLPDYESDLRALADAYSDKARLIELPEPTLEGRAVYGIEIAAGVDREDGRPVFYMDGVHHAREWPAGELTIMFAYDLLERYGTDTDVKAIVDHVRTILVPVVNPDGFDTSRESLVPPVLPYPFGLVDFQGYWRKNRRGVVDVVLPVAGKNPIAHGVDPNRNYAFRWGGDGSSDFQLSEIARGSAPFSEPESRNVRGIVLSHAVTAMITNHTYGNLILRPWGHTWRPAPDEGLLKSLGDEMVLLNGYTSQPGIALYPTTGTTEDWAYAATGSIAYTLEHGDDDQFFHPPYREIPSMYERTRRAFMLLAKAAADPQWHGRLEGRAVDGDGEPVEADLRVTKWIGTPVWSGDSVAEKIDIGARAGTDGRFSVHVNPSSRPITDLGDPGEVESYVFTVSAPGFAPRAFPVIIDRGETVSLGDVVLQPA
ncbi:MAG: hypothetical protein HY775_03465 [Acidobacteria bacterium]|nr:hypothetical protein [Acidobacteriota bacterium]